MSSSAPQERSIFSIPPIIKSLFDTFPLVTYAPYPVPARCPKSSSRPRLYVWITPEEAKQPGGGYSFDPECLKWQMYLRFCGIQYKTVSSNNHACPSNSSFLPFLIPTASSTSSISASSPTSTPASSQPPQSPAPIPATKLSQWVRDHGQSRRRTNEKGEEEEVDFERGDVQAFMELLDNEIRAALLYTTHIHPTNLHSYTAPLYTQSKSTLIYPLIASELTKSATAQIARRHPGTIDRTTIFADAEAALDALSGLLGNDTWFLGGKIPGLLDAAVFAYIHVILTGVWEEEWAGGLRKGVEKRKNLVNFWERVDNWWQSS